ncbi:hypothetical protein V1264_013456 [Littorina saxatilis]|uniref:Shugoshin C-terminal domain-containing protein n=2 Tax=Littorina saxatilis TaxID=31220 RepID=A0AAN9BQC3_9CAEN
MNLNSSTVSYYKKVKAALNGSLNTSRASQTLKANNKALAQSLQRVKQELRFALNENSRLKVENQQLSIQLRRLEIQVCGGHQQAGYEERLSSVKQLLNSISCHLLDMGTCVSDAVDICRVTPRTSQASSSRAQSLEEFKVPEGMDTMTDEELQGLPDESALQLEPESEANLSGTVMPSEDGECMAQTIAVPDMSIILEQSVLDADDGTLSLETHMDTVPEETGVKTKAEFKKAAVLTKLPQRVRNGAATSCLSSEGERTFTEVKDAEDKKLSVTKTKPESVKVVSTVPKSPPHPRRGTFVIDTKTTLSSSGSVEDIASIPMPDLVSSSPLKDAGMPEVFSPGKPVPENVTPDEEKSCGEQLQEEGKRKTTPPKSPSPVKKSKSKQSKAKVSATKERQEESKETTTEAPTAPPSLEGKSKANAPSPSDNAKKTTAVSNNDRRKSGGKKTEPTKSKGSKVAASKQPVLVKPAPKDTSFFISNPCTLNLVHKRVTGSTEGCLAAANDDKPKPAPNPVDLFVAEIKEANRKSSKVAAFIAANEPSSVAKSQCSAEMPCSTQKSQELEAEKSTDPNRVQSAAEAESDKPDQTMFFDSDMEFTGIFPQTQILDPLAEQQDEGEEQNQQEEQQATKKEESRANARSKKKDGTDKREGKKHTRTKSGRGTAAAKCQEDDPQAEDQNLDKTEFADDKKLAVALRVNKPGQMVFAVSRKEEDGSRKAIPAKLQSKARSKSKKQVEEMIRNLPQTEPESIFDFHEQTPRHVATESKSVFDLSLNETATGIVPSLAAFREKLSLATQGKKPDVPESTLLGDAPVYRMPLKDDVSSSPEPTARSRGRSTSKGRGSGRQSRSKSRSKTNEEEVDENTDPDNQKRRGRSRSRPRSKGEDEVVAEDVGSNRNSSERSRSRGRRSRPENEQIAENENSEAPRRSARSKSNSRKVSAEECEENTSDLSEKTEMDRGRSRSRVRKEDDDEYVPSKTTQKVQHKGRSRARKPDSEEENKQNNGAEEEKPAQQRGRSRARKPDSEEENKQSNGAEEEKPAQQRGRSRVRKPDSEEENRESSVAEEEKPAQRRGRSRSRRREDERKNGEDGGSKHDSSGNRETSPPSMHSEEPRGEGTADRILPTQSSTASSHIPDQDIKADFSDSDSATEPLKMVTDRRQRSKSSHNRRLYSEPERITDAFHVSPDLGVLCQETEATSSENKGQNPEKKMRHRTRSRGTVLQKNEKDPSKDTGEEGCSKMSSPQTHVQAQQEGGAEKRKAPAVNSESEIVESSEHVHVSSPRKKKCIDMLRKSQTDSNESRPTVQSSDKISGAAPESSAKEKNRTAADSPTLKKKRRSSLPVAVVQGEGDKVHKTPTQTARSKKGSRVPEPKSEEKKHMQLKFEDVKRKLKQLDSKSTSDTHTQPSKKSRPLVLPTSQSSATSVCKKSPAMSLPVRKELHKGKPSSRSKNPKSQPGSPRVTEERRSHAKTPASKPGAPAISSGAGSPLSLDDTAEDGSQEDGRRVRRAASSVCYKEPSLTAKLRRGDPHTTYLHKEDLNHIYKSPKGPRKNGKSSGLERGALHDLTNVSIAETEAQ